MPISDTSPEARPLQPQQGRALAHRCRRAAWQPVGDTPLVQTGLHLVLAWLRFDAGDPASLLGLFGRPHGPLGPQLRLVGSVLGEPDAAEWSQLPPLWWQVVKTAYHLRWLELTAASDGE